MILAQALLYI